MAKINKAELFTKLNKEFPKMKESDLDIIIALLIKAQGNRSKIKEDTPFSNIESKFIFDIQRKYEALPKKADKFSQYERIVNAELKEFNNKTSNYKFVDKIINFTRKINPRKFRDNPRSIKILIVTLVSLLSLVIIGTSWVGYQKTQPLGVERTLESVTKKDKGFYKNFGFVKSFSLGGEIVSISTNLDDRGYQTYLMTENKLKSTFDNISVENPMVWVQVLNHLEPKTVKSVSGKGDTLTVNGKDHKVEFSNEHNYVVSKVDGKNVTVDAEIFLNEPAQKDIIKKLGLSKEKLVAKSARLNSFGNLEVLFLDEEQNFYSIITSPTGKVEGRKLFDIDYKEALKQLDEMELG